MALYEPGLGYYSGGLQKFGEGGDFVTAPQLGNVFARCLAKQIEQIGAALGPYEIIEAGAGSGDTRGRPAQSPAGKPARQHATGYLNAALTCDRFKKKPFSNTSRNGWTESVGWMNRPKQDWQGVFLANEVLDALTVERFCVEADGPVQLQVTTGPEGFDWLKAPLSGDNAKRRSRQLLASLDYYSATGLLLRD